MAAGAALLASGPEQAAALREQRLSCTAR